MGVNNIDLDAASEPRHLGDQHPRGSHRRHSGPGLWIAALGSEADSGGPERFLREGRFDGWAPLLFLGADLMGATLGIVGMGRIGQAMARRASGFGMKVIYHSRTRLPAEDEASLAATHVPLQELIATSDFISLHCPLTPDTTHLIDAAALSHMKPTAYLINTARGPVVDEAALVEALAAGRIAGAGLDVYEEEPKIDQGLMGREDVVLAPHTGSATVGTRQKMAELVCNAMERVLLDGKEPLQPVNRLQGRIIHGVRRFALSSPLGDRRWGEDRGRFRCDGEGVVVGGLSPHRLLAPRSPGVRQQRSRPL